MSYRRCKGKRGLYLLLLGFAGMQLIRPALPHPPVTSDVSAPPDVKQILRTACYDCHSNETKLKWFDQIAPAYWLVAQHVKDGRKALNFSEWDKLTPADQKGKLFLSLNQILFGEMPLKSYTSLHPEARLTAADVATLKAYLYHLSPAMPSDSAATATGKEQYDQWVRHELAKPGNVQPAPNGIGYQPGYQDWKAISITDRFDNGTMRVIFGNDVAVAAIKEGHVQPWPDGTVFAKVAWTALTDAEGNVSPGAFRQVEFMIKDHKKYAATKGWGWARWLGTGLKPYGKDATFTHECTSCHQPLKNHDFVFTTPFHLH